MSLINDGGISPHTPDCDDGRRPRGGAPAAASITVFKRDLI